GERALVLVGHGIEVLDGDVSRAAAGDSCQEPARLIGKLANGVFDHRISDFLWNLDHRRGSLPLLDEPSALRPARNGDISPVRWNVPSPLPAELPGFSRAGDPPQPFSRPVTAICP